MRQSNPDKLRCETQILKVFDQKHSVTIRSTTLFRILVAFLGISLHGLIDILRQLQNPNCREFAVSNESVYRLDKWLSIQKLSTQPIPLITRGKWQKRRKVILMHVHWLFVPRNVNIELWRSAPSSLFPFRRSIQKEMNSNWLTDWVGIDCWLIKVNSHTRSMNKVTRKDVNFVSLPDVSFSSVFEIEMSTVANRTSVASEFYT